MVVTKTQYGRYFTLVGTLAEVVAALSTEVVPMANVLYIGSNGSNIDCVYHK